MCINSEQEMHQTSVYNKSSSNYLRHQMKFNYTTVFISTVILVSSAMAAPTTNNSTRSFDPMSGAIANASITITDSTGADAGAAIKAQNVPTSGSERIHSVAMALPISIICALGLL